MNFNRFLPWMFWLFLGAGGFWGCTNPTGLGQDLLEEDLLNLIYSDTLTLETGTVQGDTIRTHTPLAFLNAYVLGRLDDPIFGISEAGLYTQVIPEFLRPAFPANAVFDSLVLVLPYDTTRFYGDLDPNLTLEVFRLEQRPFGNEPHFSNAVFPFNPARIGRFSAKPSKDSLAVRDYSQGVESTLSFPHMRITLSGTLGLELLNLDTTTYTLDSLFLERFKGLYIKPSAASKSMVGVNLASDRAGMIMYYRVDTLRRQFRFQFNPFLANIPVFQHDLSGKPAADELGQVSVQNASMFVQGMAGVNGRIRIPHVRNLQNVVINKAELELRVATLAGDNGALFPPATPLVLYYRDKDNNLIFIQDVLLAQQNLPINFGGQFRAGINGEPGLYRMNLTTHFQDMVEGKVPDELIIGLFSRAESGARSVIYGSADSPYKARLRVAYTRLNN